MHCTPHANTLLYRTSPRCERCRIRLINKNHPGDLLNSILKKIGLWSFAVLALLPLSAWSQSSIVVGVSMAYFDDNFLTLVRNAIHLGSVQQANETQKVRLEIVDAVGNATRQSKQVDSFVAEKVSAIIICAADTSDTKRMTDAARKAGIPLVYVNRKPNEKMGDGVAFVGSDSLIAGQLQMQELAKRMGGRGNVAIMLGEEHTDAAQDRTKGIKEVAKKFPDIKIVSEGIANWNRQQAFDLMKKWLRQGIKIDAVAANNDEMALGALAALSKEKELTRPIIVAGIDATSEALASLKQGELALTVFQNASGQGLTAMDTAIRMFRKQKTADTILIPYELVTAENNARCCGRSH